MLEYNGKNFLTDGVVWPQKKHTKEKKNFKKCITEIEKLTEYHNKKNDLTHTNTRARLITIGRILMQILE